MTVLCQIYKSPRKEEMYLYVDMARGLEHVPEPLLARFGEPEKVMIINLTPQQKLARADAVEVLARIEEEGFYLQMPPTAAELLTRDGQGE
jgi:uncharacterized protein YcgL (UPF0745 family)